VRRRAPLVAAIIAVAAAGCAPSSLVQRERVFDRSTFAEVDVLTLTLLPRRVHDCGVQSEPRDLFIVPRVWPALDCISAALAARQPFVVRYRGMTIDSGTETVFVGTRDVVYRIYEDKAGPFTLERCARDDVRVTSGDGVTCPRWLLVRDLRKAPQHDQ
jgi:hypothetical protein